MLTVEIAAYRVALVAAIRYGSIVRRQDPVIFLYDAMDRLFGRVNFRAEEDLEGPEAAGLNGLPWYSLNYPRADYSVVLDLLRNEKRVYLHMDPTPSPWAIPSTSPEPVGEGEYTHSP